MRVFKQRFCSAGGATRLTSKWYVELRDHTGTARRIPGFHDKSATEELGRRLERLADLRRVGAALDGGMSRWVEQLPRELRNRIARIGLLEAHRYTITRPIEELVEDFEVSLSAKGTTQGQVRQVLSRLRRLLAACKVRRWGDLTATKVEVALHDMRRRAERPLSVQTSNHMLGAIKQFCRWAVENGLASEDPLRVLHKLNVRGWTTKNRTALSSSQAESLLASLSDAPVWRGVPAHVRGAIYRVALETGLRRSEIASLQVSDVELQPGEESIRIRARHAKNRRDAVLPIREETATILAELARGRHPNAQLFDLQKDWRAAEMLRLDLARAGIADKDEQGRVIDFHALRHTFASMLARANVAPRIAQSLLRHSDPRLTLGVYSHLGADDERRALAVLPSYRPERPTEGERLRSTGTEGSSISYRSACREGVLRGAGGCGSMPVLDPEKCTRGDSNPQPSVANSES